MIESVKTLESQAALQLLRRITMSELRALLAIKSAGTLTRAAVVLQVSQPALSQQLREIENKLGMALFVRHRRGLEPTPVGRVMLRLAAAMGVDMGIAAQEMAVATRNDSAVLRVGSMAVTSAGLLSVALGHFAQQSPDTQVVLMEGPRETLLEHLRHERIDFFVGRLPDADEDTDLDRETLLLDGAVVVAAARHPLVRRSRLSLEQLLEAAWILPAEDTSFHQQIAASLRSAGLVTPTARIHSYSMLALSSVVATSELIGFLPTSMFASGAMSSGLKRLAVDFHWQPSPVGVMKVRGAVANESMSRLLETLRSVSASARGATGQRGR